MPLTEEQSQNCPVCGGEPNVAHCPAHGDPELVCADCGNVWTIQTVVIEIIPLAFPPEGFSLKELNDAAINAIAAVFGISRSKK